MLDVGCGWGSFPLWAATRHGASVVGITLSAAPGRAGPRSAPRRPASPTGSRSGSWTTATCAGERFDAIASIGMVEHVGAGQHRRLRRAPSPACSSRAGGCSTTASPACATPTPRPARSPSATSSPTPRRCTSRAILLALERAGFVTRHVEELRRRLRRDPAPLGAPPRREPRRGDPPRRPRAGPRLAPLPARRPQRLRVRLHLDLPGPLHAWDSRPRAVSVVRHRRRSRRHEGKPSRRSRSPSRRRPRVSSSTE